MNAIRQHHRRGFLMLETMASIAMILLLTGALAWTLSEYSRHVEGVRIRTRAYVAAESVLNEIRAGAREDAAAFSERFKGFRVDVQRAPGEGDWKDLTRVVVRVSEVRPDSPPRPLAELAGYVSEGTP